MKISIPILIFLFFSFNCSAQQMDQVSVLDFTVRKMNSIKKVDIGATEGAVISAFGQPNSITLHDYEDQGITAKFYNYTGLTLFIIQNSNSLNGFELTSADYYVGKAGRLLIRVGEPVADLNQFVPLSYQNRNLNKGYLLIYVETTNGRVADSPIIVYFNSSGMITKIGAYL